MEWMNQRYALSTVFHGALVTWCGLTMKDITTMVRSEELDAWMGLAVLLFGLTFWQEVANGTSPKTSSHIARFVDANP